MSTHRQFNSKRIASFGETVFAKYTRLAQEHKAINLGQGFPDFEPPAFVLEALRAASTTFQQYAPLPGLPALSEVVAKTMSARLGLGLKPEENVQITVGATEALFATMQALIDPGDEVILLEPFYDAYPADVLMAGGVPKYVPLLPDVTGRWILDLAELTAAFNAKTKAIILNTPHNPSGKVFSSDELDAIIRLAHKHNAIIISDEVYEHISFVPHLSVAQRPGGWERSITISSIGKTFSVTGWKVGWAVGPKELIRAVRLAHQWIPFVVATPLQEASASVLTQAAKNDYYAKLRRLYQGKRDTLLAALKQTPLKALVPQGGYFVIADSSALDLKGDVALCEALPVQVGVTAIPPSAFYSKDHRHLAKHLLRLAFCKSDEALQEAGQRLQNLREGFKT